MYKAVSHRLVVSAAVVLATSAVASYIPRSVSLAQTLPVHAANNNLEASPAASLLTAAAPESREEQALLAMDKLAPAAMYSAPVATQAVAAAPKYTTYDVQSGDTVEAIAANHGVSVVTVLYANDMDVDDVLTIGESLKIPAIDGLIRVIQEGDNFADLAAETGVEYAAIVSANPELNPETIQPGDVVIIPGGTPPERPRMVASSRGSVSRSVRSSGTLDVWPAYGEVTSEFGYRVHPVFGNRSFHDGIDFGVSAGTPLVAASAGEVTTAGWDGGYGIVVRIDHGNGVVTQYAHMSDVSVSVGDWVGAGDLIGYSGNTGTSTGDHLHFSVYLDGSATDPWPWLP